MPGEASQGAQGRMPAERVRQDLGHRPLLGPMGGVL